MNADGSGQTNLTNTGARWTRPSATSPPTGAESSFATTATQFDVWVMNADGSGQLNVTKTPAPEDESSPAISPSGSRIVFRLSTAPTETDIAIMNANGSGGPI